MMAYRPPPKKAVGACLQTVPFRKSVKQYNYKYVYTTILLSAVIACRMIHVPTLCSQHMYVLPEQLLCLGYRLRAVRAVESAAIAICVGPVFPFKACFRVPKGLITTEKKNQLLIPSINSFSRKK